MMSSLTVDLKVGGEFTFCKRQNMKEWKSIELCHKDDMPRKDRLYVVDQDNKPLIIARPLFDLSRRMTGWETVLGRQHHLLLDDKFIELPSRELREFFDIGEHNFELLRTGFLMEHM